VLGRWLANANVQQTFQQAEEELSNADVKEVIIQFYLDLLERAPENDDAAIQWPQPTSFPEVLRKLYCKI
jgi:hypothetical protein